MAAPRLTSALIYFLSILTIVLFALGHDTFLLDVTLIGFVIWDVWIPKALVGKKWKLFNAVASMAGLLTYITMSWLWISSIDISSTGPSFVLATSGTALLHVILLMLAISPLLACCQARIEGVSTFKFLESFMVLLMKQHFGSAKKRIRTRVQLYRRTGRAYYYTFGWVSLFLIPGFGIVVGVYGFILGAFFQLGLGVFVTVLVKDIISYLRNYEIELPLEESFLLTNRDLNFYIGFVAELTVFLLSFLQLAMIVSIIELNGLTAIITVWFVNFSVLILLLIEHSFYLARRKPDRTYSHRGHVLSVLTLGLMILVSCIWHYLYGPYEAPLVPVAIWITLAIVTLVGLTVSAESSELSYLLRTPLLLFYALSLLTYSHLLQSMPLSLLLSLAMAIEVALLLTNHLMEYPVNMAHLGVMGGLLCSVIVILPLEVTTRIIVVSLIVILCAIAIYDLSWRRFKANHIADPTTRKILLALSDPSRKMTMKELKQIPGGVRANIKPTVLSLATMGILKVDPGSEGELYSIRSRLISQKVEEMKQRSVSRP
jgi:uncharacterized membrane protein